MSFNGFELPTITDDKLATTQGIKEIRDHLFKLTKQLRFTLNNLGEENLDSDLLKKINSTELSEQAASSIKDAEGNIAVLRRTAKELSSSISNAEGDISELKQTAMSLSSRIENAEGDVSALFQTAQSIEARVESAEGDVSELRLTADGLTSRISSTEGDVSALFQTADSLTARVSGTEGDVSSLQQFADSLTLSVSNGDSSSTLKLMAGSTELASQTIKFNGVVQFSNLKDGTTEISGSNIKTGQIVSNNYRYTSGNYADSGMLIDLTTGQIVTSRMTIWGTGGLSAKGSFTTEQTINGNEYKAVLDQGGFLLYKNDTKFAGLYASNGSDEAFLDCRGAYIDELQCETFHRAYPSDPRIMTRQPFIYEGVTNVSAASGGAATISFGGVFMEPPTVMATWAVSDAGEYGSLRVHSITANSAMISASGSYPTSAKRVEWVAFGY